jgi:hypothetical protein
MNDLLAARLANQALMASTLTTPLEVVQWMGAIQAQDYYGAKWSLGMRAPGSSDAQVDQALVDKQIVRTWLMRGTLH